MNGKVPVTEKKEAAGSEKNTGRRRRLVLYVIFGVLTTAVSFAVYYAVMTAGRAALGIGPDESGARYVAVYTAAQLISWVCAVLFAFFTNRAYVFDGRGGSIPRQLSSFAAGRVLTLGLDYVITLAGAYLLARVLPVLTDVRGFNLADLGAKAAASVAVLVCNYIFSRWFVFAKKSERK